MATAGSALTLTGARASCPVCDQSVPIGRKAGDRTLHYAAHDNPVCAGYSCVESGRPVPPSRLRRSR